MKAQLRFGNGPVEARSLKYVANACCGQLACGSEQTLIRRVVTDSRQTQPGDLFFALAGKRFDGHDFLGEVASKGAAAVVVNREKAPTQLPACAVVVVDDPRRALGRLATRYRQDFNLPVIAVGGSNGKTTVKELVSAVLRQRLETLWSEASFNNDIGVPLTLLRLENRHQVSVVEVGTNHPGELTALVKMLQPKFGVITNIGREHLEFFGDSAGVAQEEGSLAELLPADGMLFINGDCQWADAIASRTMARVVRVGLNPDNDWRAYDIAVGTRGVTFNVAAPKTGFSGQYSVKLLGRHQAVNALFAIAIGETFGLNQSEIRRGLAECSPPKMRLQLWQAGGVWVLDDTYNANADSMTAALQTLRELPCQGRRVAVLGDMAELGAHSLAAHEEIGRVAAELGVEQLFAVGQMANVVARAARTAGLVRIFEFADVEAAANAVKHLVKPGDLVLLKASRIVGMERVAEALRRGEMPRQCRRARSAEKRGR